MRGEITQEYLKSILCYDPDTGIFTNRVRRGPKPIGIESGTNHSSGYRMINILGKYEFSHRLAWIYVYGSNPDGVIDHINRNRSDNRIENLRVTNANGNCQNLDPIINKKPNMTSKYLGVHWSKRAKKWHVLIRANGKRFHIGYFSSEHDAAAAYLMAKKKYHIPVIETSEELTGRKV